MKKRNCQAVRNTDISRKTKFFCPKVSKEVFGCCCRWQKQTIENGKPFGGAMGQSPIFQKCLVFDF
ncbi:MAG: hypothetical protein ACLRUN_12440 [Christensenellales bacterium]|jgi:type II secretory pathway component PulF